MKIPYQLFKTISIAVLLVRPLIVCAQNTFMYNPLCLGTKHYECNLNGAVQSQQIRYSYIKPGFKKHEYMTFMIINDSKMFSPAYVEFYKNNHVKMTGGFVYDTVFYKPDKKHATSYDYTAEDLNDKSQKKTNLKYYSNVYSRNLSLKPDQIINYYSDGGKRILDYKYKYKFDKKNRVKEELFYVVPAIDDSISSNKTRLKDLEWKVTFFYNEKDQVIKQKIYGGPSLDFKSAGSSEYIVVNFGASLDIPNLETSYAYDNKGRMTEIVLYSGQKLLMQEKYYYHPTKDYVEKSVYYSVRNDFYSRRKKIIRYFNEYGDIIKKEFVPNFLGQYIDVEARTRFYDYEYDSHNNWIKCYIYLEGTKESGPTLISEKKLVYYDENTK